MESATRKVSEKLIVVWRPQEGPQSMAISCAVEDILFGGARGGGKTDWLMGDWIRHSSQYGQHARGILFRRTMNELEKIKERMDIIFPLLGATYKIQKNIWIMPNGSILKLRYLDRDDHANNYQGHEYTWMGVDEMGNFPSPSPIDKLVATLRSADGVPCEFRATANPGGKGHEWIKERYIREKEAGIPFISESGNRRRVFIPSRVKDNKILLDNDPGYISRLKESGPAYLVDAWLNGNWDIQPGTSLIKAKDFQWHDELPSDIDFVVSSMDTAFQTKTASDKSVCLTAYVNKRKIYIEHGWADRVEFPELKRRAESIYAKFRPHVMLIESAASGQSLLQELKRETRIPVKAVKVDKDKITRVNAALPMIEAGNVSLKRGQAWTNDFLDEVSVFPNGSHDDWVDALSQLINHVRDTIINEPYILDMNEEEPAKNEADAFLVDDYDDEYENKAIGMI